MCGLDLLYRLLGAYEWSLPLNQIADVSYSPFVGQFLA